MRADEAAGRPVIRIAAGLIVDASGRVLLVRKRGTHVFMQAGGKIEPDETPRAALSRELREELGLRLAEGAGDYLGRFVAEAANEAGHMVEAEVFFVETAGPVCAAAEIEETAWLDVSGPVELPLAPLTRDHLLPLWRAQRPSQPRG